MEIEEFKKRLRECLMDVDSLLDEEIDNLYVFFKEYAKNYARSLVLPPEEIEKIIKDNVICEYAHREEIPEAAKCINQKMLRRIEEE